MIWFKWYMFVFVYFSIFTFIVSFASLIEINLYIKREYDYKGGKHTLYERILFILRWLLRSFIPLENIGLFYQFVVIPHLIKEGAIKNMLAKGIIKEKTT